jgi:hypothetical protein
MSFIFDNMSNLADELIKKLEKTGDPIDQGVNKFKWTNRIFRAKNYRRAHIEVLDVRDTKKMWIMHICIFPHLDDSSPIFGFDVICGANKITGVFHDYSITGDKDHFMVKWFQQMSEDLVWKKDRELPDWGKRIFSPYMIAAGNVNTDDELEKIIDFSIKSMDYYLEAVGTTIHNTCFAKEHNYYCKNQKMNEHTPRFLINCGYAEEEVKHFTDRYLFPEVTV